MAHNRKPYAKKTGLFSREFRDLLHSAPASNFFLEQFKKDTGAEDGCQVDSTNTNTSPVSESVKKDAAKCLTCGSVFMSREDQVSHYQLDWHRYNLKRRLKGMSSVDQEEFEKIADDTSSISGSESDSSPSEESNAGPHDNDKCDDDGSNTGCEEEEEETEQPTVPSKSPYFQFGLKDSPKLIYSLFRSVLPQPQSGRASSSVYESLAGFLKPQVWIILMRSGGHFAGAVYRGSELVAHKTFHRYTVRAKRGTAQSVRDGQQGGHQPKSAGASLRRYNEAALASEIQGVISSWSSYVQEASCIFVRTPKYSKWVFVGEKGAFPKGEERLRSIPFQTRRPTLAEVRVTFDKLSAVLVRSVKPEEIKTERREEKTGEIFSPSNDKKASVRGCGTGSIGAVCVEVKEIGESEEVGRCENESGEDIVQRNRDVDNDDGKISKQRKKKKKQLEKERQVSKVVLPPFINDLLELIADPPLSSLDRCLELLSQAGLSHDSHVTSPDPQSQQEQEESLKLLNSTWNGDTVLHTAALNGCSDLIPVLMEHGADPTLRNAEGHTPYFVSKNKSTRDAFRRFMAAHLSAWDYSATQIPSPLTEEMEKERSKKEAEKKRERKKKKAKEQQEKQTEARREEEERKAQLGQQRMLGSLTQREKLAMAAERRMASQLPTSAAALNAGICSGCDKSLLGVVPFERLDYKYCSIDCLKQHRIFLSQHKR